MKQVNNEMLNGLVLYVNNTRNLYENTKLVCKSLARKKRKGNYDDQKAIKAFYNLVNLALKQYYIEFGGAYAWYLLANTATRQAVAKELLEEYIEDIEEFTKDL